ncbi:MAG: DUF1549 and DUF1553 domain-containing protein, partial [Gemmataceae bacterium]|nr:DUF1549 and DUF1553 domain-containing protein [Gemmataceae bacterium]MDW8265145.1 DUF1549 and DUF1553 domain-containing protein [Gemmataceae bacterium]
AGGLGAFSAPVWARGGAPASGGRTPSGAYAMPVTMIRRAVMGGILMLMAGVIGLAAPAGDPAPAGELWSLMPITRPAVPAVRDTAWPRSPVDRFVLARLEAAGLKPNPDADRATLIRRAAYDLTGLPPTVAEIDAFVADPATDDEAFARVVDHYLASPRFGERWARHWLDVVRYADSVGRTWNAPFLYAWRYRDYVIDAFNQDKPFDRFVMEQLAGDLLPARSVAEEREQRIATGFLALGSLPIAEGRLEGFTLDRIDDQIDVTTRAFLGLTVACARCHDHKYEPITMRDYYALAGIFYSTRTLSGQGIRAEGNLNYVDGRNTLRLPADGSVSSADGVYTMADFLERSRRGERDVRFTFDPNRALGVMEGAIRDCPIRIKGDPYDRGATPPRGDIHIPGLPPLPPIPATASGRLQLARWLTAADNPLPARVMANRVWQHLFGRGLVATPDDFGSTGEPPTHPELLDYLASEFQTQGWSVKRLIRTLMLSRVYRLSSAGRDEGRKKDPQNALYWRADLRRLEFEPLRDSMLVAAGRLSFQRPEGIPVSGIGGRGRSAATVSLLPLDSPYRTVYLPVLRSLLPEAYGTFDFPDPCQVKGRREVTTVAPQALYFLNNDFCVACARGAAERLLAEPGLDDAGRVRLAYRRLLGRPPQLDELADALELLREVSAPSPAQKWAVLVQGLMATAEFRYVR